MNSYKDLFVWQKSVTLCTDIYSVTKTFPKEELYGITNQMRRSAVSIASNIAEGYRRGYSKEYRQFLQIAFGSAAELETQLIITKNIQFIDESRFLELNNKIEEILKMLNSLIAKIRSD